MILCGLYYAKSKVNVRSELDLKQIPLAALRVFIGISEIGVHGNLRSAHAKYLGRVLKEMVTSF